MVSSNNKDVYIAGNITKDEVEVKLVARFLSSILAIKNVSAATKTTNLRIFWASQQGY